MKDIYKKIAQKNRSFVVAEIGQNHNGSLRLAKRLVNAAKRAGADAVKTQTFTPEKLVSKKTPTYGKLDPSLPKLQWQMYKQAELSRTDHEKLFLYARKIGMILFSSVWDEENVDFLDSLGMPIYKIGSGDLTHLPLLRYIAKKKKPMIISTGMGTIKEIREAVEAVEAMGNKELMLLHCTSSYPCEPKHMNLKGIQTLMKHFPYPIGLSDHSLDNTAAIAATAMGAALIEKHFTCDKKIKGIDHWLSADIKQMKELIEEIRKTEQMMGDGRKGPNRAERITLKLARRSVVSTQDIPKGAKISKQMLSIRRPGTGILPKEFEKVIGKVAKVNIPSETPIKWQMIK